MTKWTKWTVAGYLSLSLIACGGDTTDEAGANNATECNGGKCDVIGDDDRRDEFQGEVTDQLREYARSTAMIVDNTVMIQDGEYTSFESQTLGEAYMMCPDSTFVDQPTTGFCTGTLIAPDVMLTNGHCITNQQACESSSFVFDYAIAEEGQALTSVPSENVYQCEQVLAWDYTSDCDVDFAIVRLDRNVAGREPLPSRPSLDPLDGDNLVIIGHPFGLPRKYALLGGVLKEGSNVFTTTHDIFGGNSGSSIIDANTGEIQGLVTCGGSNLTWEYYDEGWALDRKTGKACEDTCDDEGIYTDGSWEECTMEGTRRRCVCDGTQLVWEKRECLPFEGDTGGQCSREAQIDQFTCETAPWLCPTPVSQHTKHFAHFVGDWKTYEGDAAIELPASAEATSVITIEDEGVIQAASVHFDLVGPDGDVESFDFTSVPTDLTITLTHGDEVFTLSADGATHNGTAFGVENSPSGSAPFQLPFILDTAQGLDIGGEWKLEVKNAEFIDYTIHSWSLTAIAKPTLEDIEYGEWPCTGGCELGWEEGPADIVESFEGDASDIDTEFVQGTLADGWDVEILDESGAGYEVYKTRRSQTMSLEKGEFAIVKDFGVELGGRDLTIDYRYDGDGWFQVWADDHIILSRQGFAQAKDTIAIPMNSQSIRVVLGAADDAQLHEATIYSMEITASQLEPASCEGVFNCVQTCDPNDTTCTDGCISAGSADAQANFWNLNDCINNHCADTNLSDSEYENCVYTTCADPVSTCVNGG